VGAGVAVGAGAVFDVPEEEAAGWGGGAGFGSVAGIEEAAHEGFAMGWVFCYSLEFEECTDEGADLLPKKGVASDLVYEFFILEKENRLADMSRARGAFVLRRSKGRKIVLAQHDCGHRIQNCNARVVRHKMRAPQGEWVRRAAAHEEIAVSPQGRIEARMKIGRCFFRGKHADVARHELVECEREAVGGDGLYVGIKTCDLAHGVHAGIGAACAVDADFVSVHFGKCLFELFLDGAAVFLSLPARKIGAVVGEHKFYGPQSGRTARSGIRAGLGLRHGRLLKVRILLHCFRFLAL